MYFKIGDGLVVDSNQPIKFHALAIHSHVVRRNHGSDSPPDIIELRILKNRSQSMEASPFWAAFKGAFPSAEYIIRDTGDVIHISDAFDCINFTFKLHT